MPEIVRIKTRSLKFRITASLSLLSAFVACSDINAQSGGDFAITQGLIANGSGTSSDGTWQVVGSIGQSIAGTHSGGAGFTVSGGVWTSTLTPTAAGIVLRGRIVDNSGRGVTQFQVNVKNLRTGEIRVARTNSFGSFSVENLVAGDSYLLSGSSKPGELNPRILYLNDNLKDLVLSISR